jgi:hypothetical protein
MRCFLIISTEKREEERREKRREKREEREEKREERLLHLLFRPLLSFMSLPSLL